MADEQIDKLYGFIHSTTESIKILGDTDHLDEIKRVLYGNQPIPEGCPSRASLAEFGLQGLKGRLREALELIDQLEVEIFARYKDKK